MYSFFVMIHCIASIVHWLEISTLPGYPISMGVPLKVKHNGPHKFVRLIDKALLSIRWILLRWVIVKFLAWVFCFHSFTILFRSGEWWWDIRSYKSSETSFWPHTNYDHALLVCIKYNEHNKVFMWSLLVGSFTWQNAINSRHHLLHFQIINFS